MKTIRTVRRLLMITGLLTVLTSVWTLVHPSVYNGFVDAGYIAESLGQDIVSLLIGAALCVCAWRLQASTRRLWIAAAGALWYLLYAYAIYAFGAVYNVLFFCYLAIMGLSLFTGILVLNEMLKNKSGTGGKNATAASVFLLGTAAVLSMIWSGAVVENITAGTKARETVIYVMDLFFVLPAFVMTAVQMIQKRSGSFILGGVCLTKAVTIGLSIVCGQTLKAVQGFQLDAFLCAFFGLFTLIGIMIGSDYFKTRLE